MMWKTMSLIVILGLAITVVPAPLKAQNTSDEQAIKAVVERLFRALEKKDIDTVMACWSDQSVERDSFRRWAQDHSTNVTDQQFSNLGFARWAGGTDQISVLLRVDVKWHRKAEIESGQDQMVWAVRFVNEKGNWKWLAIRFVLSELVEKLRSAKSPEERMNLVQKDRDILSVGILHLLEGQANQHARNNNFQEAIRLNWIALEVGELLGHTSDSAALYNQRGKLLLGTGAYDEALRAFESALKIAEEVNHKEQQVQALGDSGKVYLKKTKYLEAKAKLEKAVVLAESFGIKEELPAILANIAIACHKLGRYKEALEQGDRSVRIARQTHDRGTEVQVLAYQAGIISSILVEKLCSAKTPEDRKNLLQKERDILTAGVLRELGGQAEQQAQKKNYEVAITLNGIALEVADVLGNTPESADLYYQRGKLLSYTLAYDKALKAFEFALGLYQKSGNSAEAIGARNAISELLVKQGAYPQALEQLNLGLKAARETKDPYKEADVLGNIGQLYSDWRKYSDALANYKEALKICGADQKDLQADLLNSLGGVYQKTGEYDQALEVFGQSEKIAEELEDPELQAKAISNAGLVYLARGKYLKAIARFEKAAGLEESLGIKGDQALILNSIAIAYGSMGQFKYALEQCARGLILARQIPDRTIEAGLLVNQAWLYTMDDKPQEAVASLREWLQIPSALEIKEVRASALFTFALSFIMKEEVTPELEQLVVALEGMANELDSIAIRTLALLARGAVHVLKDEWEKVIPLMETMLRASPSTELEGIAYFFLGFAYQHQKEWKTASTFYRKAIDRVEMLRTDAKDPMLQAYLFSMRRAPYLGLAKSLLELGADVNEVIKISEQGKSRSLLDLIDGGKVASSKLLTDSDSQKKQELKSRITTIRAQLEKELSMNPSGEQIDKLKQQLNEAQRMNEIFEHQLSDARPEPQAQSAKSEPVTLDAVKEKIFTPYPNICLLSYFVEDNEVMLFAITKGKDASAPVKVAHYSLKDEDGDDLTQKVLLARLLKFRLRLASESGIYKPDAKALYKLLIGPAAADISGKSHLIIIPDQALNTFPFQTLIDSEGNHLIDKYSVSYAPSITALIRMMNLADGRKNQFSTMPPLFSLGRSAFPDQAEYRTRELPWAEAQAKSIAELFGARPFIGSDATRTNAVAEMGKARYIHFATHGELNEAAPMYSAILLGKGKDDDGMLYAGDLMNLNLHAELVTLSACNTALGKQVNGEGILGLAWALFVAGAPSSVVTQWSVRDDSMNKLMLEFYRQLRNSESKGAHISKAEALKRAQVSLMQDPKYKHPYYWAPTVLVGDWR